ncbi:hypothetical protein BDP27DRAFT_1406752 [Rhodocollybia butyracea]|uniref:Uncharacterized protein n=1 Tax=Rhodocollybia butyracea TaxID=206335 RepID=A0A9P5PFU1_9AGAR|nr:hypothetical protein BDP27DRAFT_1406752 [Rhodocollybia butyracea]
MSERYQSNSKQATERTIYIGFFGNVKRYGSSSSSKTISPLAHRSLTSSFSHSRTLTIFSFPSTTSCTSICLGAVRVYHTPPPSGHDQLLYSPRQHNPFELFGCNTETGDGPTAYPTPVIIPRTWPPKVVGRSFLYVFWFVTDSISLTLPLSHPSNQLNPLCYPFAVPALICSFSMTSADNVDSIAFNLALSCSIFSAATKTTKGEKGEKIVVSVQQAVPITKRFAATMNYENNPRGTFNSRCIADSIDTLTALPNVLPPRYVLPPRWDTEETPETKRRNSVKTREPDFPPRPRMGDNEVSSYEYELSLDWPISGFSGIVSRFRECEVSRELSAGTWEPCRDCGRRRGVRTELRGTEARWNGEACYVKVSRPERDPLLPSWDSRTILLDKLFFKRGFALARRRLGGAPSHLVFDERVRVIHILHAFAAVLEPEAHEELGLLVFISAGWKIALVALTVVSRTAHFSGYRLELLLLLRSGSRRSREDVAFGGDRGPNAGAL